MNFSLPENTCKSCLEHIGKGVTVYMFNQKNIQRVQIDTDSDSGSCVTFYYVLKLKAYLFEHVQNWFN